MTLRTFAWYTGTCRLGISPLSSGNKDKAKCMGFTLLVVIDRHESTIGSPCLASARNETRYPANDISSYRLGTSTYDPRPVFPISFLSVQQLCSVCLSGEWFGEMQGRAAICNWE